MVLFLSLLDFAFSLYVFKRERIFLCEKYSGGKNFHSIFIDFMLLRFHSSVKFLWDNGNFSH